MKTQQRSFVVEIKSTRRRSKMQPKSIWGDTDFKALVREAEGAHLFKHGVASEALSKRDDLPANSPLPVEPADNIDPGDEHSLAVSVVEDDPTQPPQQDTDAVPTPSAKGLTRRRATTRKADANGKSKPSRGAIADELRAPSSEELAGLEEDNRRLKSLLAERLHQQNLQLRTMLERFAIPSSLQ